MAGGPGGGPGSAGAAAAALLKTLETIPEGDRDAIRAHLAALAAMSPAKRAALLTLARGGE